MDAAFWTALAATAIGGVTIATQAPVNAALARGLGSPLAAATVSFAVGFAALAVVTVARGAVPNPARIAAMPWWVWTGGLCGAWYVVATVMTVERLGVVTLVAALVFGQLTAALVVDTVGAFGLPVHPVSLTRVAAVLCVGAGLVLSRL